MTIPHPKRDVQTKMNYHKPVKGNKLVFDFNKPETKDLFDENQKNGYEAYDVTVRDVRGQEEQFTYASNGFQFLHDEVPKLEECESEDQLREYLIPHSEDLVKKEFGANRTIVFSKRIRSKYGSMGVKHEDYNGPFASVHADFSPEGAMQVLEAFVPDDTERAKLLENNRYYLINTWRPLKPIKRDPFAVCDWQSIVPERDWMGISYPAIPGRREESNQYYHPDHKWHWLSDQQPYEPMVFVQYDSELHDEGGMCTPHSAFVDPENNDGPPRESIEIKMLAFVPKNKA